MRNLVKVFIIFEVFLNFVPTEQSHPYGASVNILNKIENDKNRQFSIETEIIENTFLHPDVKDRKIVVLSIIGAFRKGKSFFLDYCLRFLYANYRSVSNMDESTLNAANWMGEGSTPLQGFSWKHGRIADTKGIKIWSDVFLHDTPTEKIAIVVMDTQGLFEPHSTTDENGRIFGLSTLISSIQILNIKDILQENQLEHLEMATNLAKIIVKKQKSTQWKPFQKLLFLFRDWTDESIGYGYEGGQKYLDEEVLLVNKDQNTKGNVIRQNIRSSFDDISCFLLNFPGSKITKGHGEWSTLDKVFVANLKLLIESLLLPENLIKKSTLGKDLTAEEFQALIKIYFNAFANATLPDTENILQLAIDNQMQTIVNAQLKVFNQLQADLDIDFDREDFVEWVEEVRENNTKTAINGFLKAEKLDDEESSMKFEEFLKVEIGIIFENWNQTNMKIYEEFQEQKRLREIEDCFNLQVSNYQEIMNKDIDFNQDDFEAYYEDLHNSTLKNSIQELEKMRFKDDESEKAVASLMDKLNENYEAFRTSKTQEYENHLNVVALLADTQFETYKSILYQNVDYENQTDFEGYLDVKHSSARKTSIERFENTELAFTPRKAQFEEEIIKKIDNEYQTWKKATMKIYEDLQDKKRQKEIEKGIDLQVRSYQEVMSNNIDFNQDDFETYYEDLHNSMVANAVKELEKLGFKDEISKLNSTNSLEVELSEVFVKLNASKSAEYDQHLKNFAIFVNSQFDAYKIDLNRDIEYENQTDFEGYIDEKHSSAKNASIDKFENAHQLTFTPRKDQFEEELIQKIDSEYETWKNATMNIYAKFEDKKQKSEIEIAINLQVRSYQKMMSNNLDFNQDEFETYYEDLHKSTKGKAIQELEKLKFKDDASKLNSTELLQERLEEYYILLKSSKIAEFNQHLGVVSALTDTQFELYKNNRNLNLSYESNQKFEEYLNEKHLAAKAEANITFDDLPWPTFAPRKTQFKEKLITVIDSEYLTWKVATIKVYEDLQEQSIQAKFEKLSNLQVRIYTQAMNKVNFNQDDFEKYYEELHESKMTNAIQELQQLPFKDEASKELFTKSFEVDLNDVFETLKTSKTQEYNQHLKVVSTLADTQFATYKSNIVQNINYEKFQNFEEYLDNKHATTKNAAVNNFENADLPYAPRKSQFKKKLIGKIDNEYPAWKAEIIESFNKKGNDKMEQLMNAQLNKYKQFLNENTDSKQFDFIKNIKAGHERKKESILPEFMSITNFLNQANLQSTFYAQLSSSIDSAYDDWFASKKPEYDTFVNDQLQSINSKLIEKYQRHIGNLHFDINSNQFLSNLDKSLSSEKDQIIAEFNRVTRDINDRTLVNSIAEEFSNKIDSLTSSVKSSKINEYRDNQQKIEIQNRAVANQKPKGIDVVGCVFTTLLTFGLASTC